MEYDFGTYLALALSILAPAVVVFGVLMALRIRRNKFHRQRIARRHGKTHG